jgi:ubiquinone/menaquinone biosynthesis C-methylase UbiE
MGTAAVQSKLWGMRAADWTEVQEGTVRPVYDEVVATLVKPGAQVLDVGCGAGLFCELAAKRGASVAGFDATPELLSIARRRAPAGDFREGEMESLPFGDAAFDVVTGFNAFQYAADPVKALGEARRVVRHDGRIVVMVWGAPEDCDAAVYLKSLGAQMPPPPPGAPGPFALSIPGALEKLAREAGLTPLAIRDVDTPWFYANLEKALRGMLAAGPAMRAIQHAGEEQVRRALAEAIAPFRSADGAYRMNNKCRYLVATP